MPTLAGFQAVKNHHSMSLFKEHRLLHITITSLNAQRTAVGDAPLTQTSMDARSADSRVLPGATAGPSGQPQTQGQLLAASNGGAGPQGSPPPTQQRTNPFGNRVTPGGIAANAAANNGASMSSAATLGQGINAATQGVPPSTQQQQEQTDLLSGAASQKTTGSATTGAPTADNPSAPPSAPGAPGNSATQPPKDLVLEQLKNMATTPEGKLALAQYEQNLIDTENARKTADAQYTQEKTNSDAAYADVSAKNKAMEDTLNKNATDVRGLIDTIKKQNQDALDTQQKAGSDQLAWQAAKDSRTLSKSEVQAHQSLVAQIALEGGFGQDAAMVQVATSDANFESKIQDVQSKLGVDQTNLAAKYSALYVKNNNDYLTKSIANANDLQSTLMTVSQNENTAELGQTSANNGFLKDWYAEQNSITTKLASDNTTLVKDMQTAINQKATEDKNQANIDRQNVQVAENLYISLATKYPAGGIPQDQLDNLNRAFPTMKFTQTGGDPSLAQINGKRSGAGLGGTSSGPYTFSGAELTKSGSPTTLPNYLAQQATAAGIKGSNVSAAQIAQWTDQYNAKLATYNQYDPSTLAKSFDDWSSKLSAPEAKRDTGIFQQYMNKKDYQGASDYIDSLKPALPAQQEKTIADAAKAVPLLSQAEAIYRQLAVEGMTGTFEGKALSSLPSWNTAQAKLQAIQTSAALALGQADGLTGRSALGALSALSTQIPSQSMTPEQALGVMKQTQDTLLSGVHSDLNIGSANYKTNYLKKNFDDAVAANPFGADAPAPVTVLTPKQQAFHDSLYK